MTDPVSMNASNRPQAAPPGRERGVVSSDFQTFLRMLTAQIQNQDPLNPMDSSDYATQLATFSGVEQQVRTNDLLSSVVARLSSSDMTDLARWIGLEAQFGNFSEYDGSPVDLALLTDPRADQAVLVVRDSYGVEVQRLPVAHDAVRHRWEGRSDSGDPLPFGVYTFELENFAFGTRLSATPAERFGRVVEARIDGDETVLVLDNGDLILAADVTAIRGSDP